MPLRPPLESGTLPKDPHDEWSEATLEMFPGENDGDRHTPLLFDSLITPIFPESVVREVMARADAAERAASAKAAAVPTPTPTPTPLPTHKNAGLVWPKAAPVVESWEADTTMQGVRVTFPAVMLDPDEDDFEPPTALRVVASRGHHISWMIWVAMGLLLALLMATVCKAAKRLSQNETAHTQMSV